MVAITALLVFLFYLWIIIITVDWSSDNNTKYRYENYGFSTYAGFKNQYYKVEWEYCNGMLVGKQYGTIDRIYPAAYVSLIFNEKQMLMRDPLSNVLMKLFIKRRIKEYEVLHKKSINRTEWR